MKLNFLILLLFNLHFGSAQSVEGYWKTVDDNGIAKSIVKIYKTEKGTIEGKVHKIMKASERDKLCTACEGDMKNKPIQDLVIMKDLQKSGNEYKDGQITDPVNGKTYDGKIWLDEDDSDILHVRGYIAFFYKTQHWKRVTE